MVECIVGCDNDGMHLYCLASKNKRKTAYVQKQQTK